MLNYNFYLIGNFFLFKEVSFQGIELRQYLYTDFFMDMLIVHKAYQSVSQWLYWESAVSSRKPLTEIGYW